MSNVKEYFINELVKIPSNDPRFEDSNGKIFSDSEYARAGQWVTGLRVVIGDGLVNSIQFVYDHDPELSECYGNMEGKLIEQEFADDEYITKFSWVSGFNTYYAGSVGALTWHIQVTTNKGFYTFGDDPDPYFCGDKKTYTIKADEGHRLVGIRCKARRNDKDAQPGDKIGQSGRAVNNLFAISHVYECKLKHLVTEDDTYYNDYYSVIRAQKLTEIKGAVCDSCINRLQFVYDDDDTLTCMHGSVRPGEQPFSLKLNEDSHLKHVQYKTAECDDPKYSGSTILTYLRLEDQHQCYEAGIGSKSLPGSFYHKYTYDLYASDGTELWAFSGTYHNYMGNFLSYYRREVDSNRKALAAASAFNSTGNKALVVNVETVFNNGVDTDKNVDVLLQNWRRWYNASNVRWKEWYGSPKNLIPCDFIPTKSNVQAIDCNVSAEDVKKAILSGQYEYVTFHCHGVYSYVGNQKALFDNKWVLQNKNRFNNMVFHFNCCECGYRLIDSGTNESGVAASFIKAGAVAAFGYTVALLVSDVAEYSTLMQGGSSEDVKKARMFSKLNSRFIGAVDKAFLTDKKTPNEAAIYALQEFYDIRKQTKSFYGLRNYVLMKVVNNFIAEMKSDDFVETSERYCVSSGSGKARTEEIKDYLETVISNKADRMVYTFYFHVYFASKHFVGPGSKSANPLLKKKNLGELCRQYGNSDVKTDL